jgi:serine/threonine-protein kinase
VANDFESIYQSLGLAESTQPGKTDATWGQLSTGPTIVSGSRPGTTAAAPMSTTLPQLEIATPLAARPADGNAAELTPLEVLGEGGMGQVLVARQWSLEREVAVKVLRSVATDEAARALVDEARIAGGLEHPGVVPIYALARDANGLPAVMMKRVEGTSWAELMHDPEHRAWAHLAPLGKDRLEAQVGILIQVCNALAFAHRRGVLHRDLKPANVLVGELGEVYLADWGVATRKGQHGPPRLVGTPAYMAPEMVQTQLVADERTDVYLVGATLYELLSGAPPHRGQDLKQVLQLAWEAAPPSFSPSVPAELAALCARCLARRPEDRPADALAVRDALLAYLQHQGSVRLLQQPRRSLLGLDAGVHGRHRHLRVHPQQPLRRWAVLQWRRVVQRLRRLPRQRRSLLGLYAHLR